MSLVLVVGAAEGHTDGDMRPGKHSSQTAQGPWGPVSSERWLAGFDWAGKEIKGETTDEWMQECGNERVQQAVVHP